MTTSSTNVQFDENFARISSFHREGELFQEKFAKFVLIAESSHKPIICAQKEVNISHYMHMVNHELNIELDVNKDSPFKSAKLKVVITVLEGLDPRN